MGGGCSIVGFLCGLYIQNVSISDDYSYFWLLAMISAFLTGSTIWWKLIEKAGPKSIVRGASWIRGAIVGALAGVMGHYVCWYLVIVFFSFNNLFNGISADVMSRPPLSLLTALIGALTFTPFSLVFVGFITIPAGALIGGIIGAWRIHGTVAPDVDKLK